MCGCRDKAVNLNGAVFTAFRHSTCRVDSKAECDASVLSWKLVEEEKDVEIIVRQGANRSDSRCYREDLQRSMAVILGIFMKQISNSGH